MVTTANDAFVLGAGRTVPPFASVLLLRFTVSPPFAAAAGIPSDSVSAALRFLADLAALAAKRFVIMASLMISASSVGGLIVRTSFFLSNEVPHWGQISRDGADELVLSSLPPDGGEGVEDERVEVERVRRPTAEKTSPQVVMYTKGT